MRNSPPISRVHGPVFRAAAPSNVTFMKDGGGPSTSTDEVLRYLVFQFCLQRRLRQGRIELAEDRLRLLSTLEAAAIEIGEVPSDLSPPPRTSIQPKGRTEPEPIKVRRFRTCLYTASWNVLGQYVARILDRRARNLQAYLEAKAFERLAQAEQRAAADALTRKWLPKTERLKRKRLRVMKRAAYLEQVHLELKRELDALIRSAHWLDTFTRDPENTFCMATAKNHRRVFFLVHLNEEGVGGKVVAVYDTPRFNRMTVQNGRRNYRNAPNSRH